MHGVISLSDETSYDIIGSSGPMTHAWMCYILLVHIIMANIEDNNEH